MRACTLLTRHSITRWQHTSNALPAQCWQGTQSVCACALFGFKAMLICLAVCSFVTLHKQCLTSALNMVLRVAGGGLCTRGDWWLQASALLAALSKQILPFLGSCLAVNWTCLLQHQDGRNRGEAALTVKAVQAGSDTCAPLMTQQASTSAIYMTCTTVGQVGSALPQDVYSTSSTSCNYVAVKWHCNIPSSFIKCTPHLSNPCTQHPSKHFYFNFSVPGVLIYLYEIICIIPQASLYLTLLCDSSVRTRHARHYLTDSQVSYSYFKSTPSHLLQQGSTAVAHAQEMVVHEAKPW